MKSKIKNEAALMAGVLLLFLFVDHATQAQEKGKPWNAPEAAAAVKNTTTVDEAYLAAGKTLYAKHCKSCHGSSGRGDGPKSANLDISCGDFTSEEFKKEPEGQIFWKTSEGRDPMPSFKKKVSDEERWQIVAYIATLDKKKK